ncbi:MAG: response regulator [Verrucomicrobiota bacterium]
MGARRRRGGNSISGGRTVQDRTRFPFPSVVLSDLKMPRCTGLELVQWLKQDAELRTLPFIMFSASDQPTDVGSAYHDGANWYLAKPSTFDALVDMLQRLVENLSNSR